ncbi:hypothetical protein JW710_03800 [Candidatus Dojkabacteria bacterium]|nr:hypothetical protein [Candidatus Dojkabacteria bacterium]
MLKREYKNTSKHGTGGQTLKSLSNEVFFSFFDKEKIEKVCQVMYKKALDGDIRACKDILNRALGKPTEQTESFSETTFRDVTISSYLDKFKKLPLEEQIEIAGSPAS